MRALLRSFANHETIASVAFVGDLVRLLGNVMVLDCGGLVMPARDDERVLLVYVLPRRPSDPCRLAWGERIVFGTSQDLRRFVTSPAQACSELREDAPFESLMRRVGLQAVAHAPVAFGEQGGARVLVAVAPERDAYAPDLALLAEIGRAIGLLWGFVGGLEGDECAPTGGAAAASGSECSNESMRLARVGRLASIGRIAGGFVHEINNPATSIILAAEQLNKALECSHADAKAPDAHDQAMLVEGIAQAASQIRGAVSSFHLLASASGEGLVGPLDLTPIFEAAISLTEAAFRTRATIETHLEHMPLCPSSYASLGTALIELLVNAIQSIPSDSGVAHRIVVRIGTVAKTFVVSVQDTGVGIARELLPQLESSSCTTGGKGEQAGLGLVMVRSTVEQLGGTMHLRSEMGQGTTAELIFPL